MQQQTHAAGPLLNHPFGLDQGWALDAIQLRLRESKPVDDASIVEGELRLHQAVSPVHHDQNQDDLQVRRPH